MIKSLLLSATILLSLSSFAQTNTSKSKNMDNTDSTHPHTLVATFGTGCFWCTEAIFQELEGVVKVTSGYSGGHVANPTYKEVCTGTTGHAECLNIEYDPKKISFDELLEVFWQTHDPTTLNRQGNDVGTQYRSVVFYHNHEQKEITEKYIKELNKSGAWKDPIVTTLEPFVKFYPAEDYHQNYYLNNGEQPYCHFVIRPKVEKFEKVFKGKLKKK
ncbi:MAG TPA: peptide-methionine (S)-S-oxide reductase MsrA [Ferruginibacter sp.]|jgi:peptide-methionine (S)-S-oxide reductase|nr:peptide-methionine (S)-S-oxide reductase MsrA [Ferruginibacter sp.]